jgi:hypothetical protein
MWELFYSFFFSWGLGMVLSAQFVGLSASTPEEFAATSITSYYLFQQAGTMIGITMTTVLQHLVFKERLEAKIGESPEDLKVRTNLGLRINRVTNKAVFRKFNIS